MYDPLRLRSGDIFFKLVLGLLFLHLTHFSQHYFTEYCTSSNLAETLLARAADRINSRSNTLVKSLSCERFSGSFSSVTWNIVLILLVFGIFLELECLDTICELDQFDTTPETGTSNITSDF